MLDLFGLVWFALCYVWVGLDLVGLVLFSLVYVGLVLVSLD